MRVPSWTDRILYKSDHCALEYYNRAESQFSDHRPIVGIFACQVTSIDRRRREEVAAKVSDELNSKKGSTKPSEAVNALLLD